MRCEEDVQIKLHFPHVLLSGKTWAGGISVMSFKPLSLPPAPPDELRNQFAAGKLGQAATPILNLYFAFKAQTCAAGQVNGIAGVFDSQNASAHFYGDIFAQTAVSV